MATSGSGVSIPAVHAFTGSYTLLQLIAQWRARLDDVLEPYLWSNEELTSYADYLQKLLAVDLQLFEDRTTAEICNVSLVQNDTVVTVSPRIVVIRKARIDGDDNFLDLVSDTYMDSQSPGWESEASGVPNKLIARGIGPNKVRIHPPLAAATATLLLVVRRLPLVDLDYDSHGGDSLEVDKYAHLLIHGIMNQAYLKQDSDTYDPKKAEQHRVLWEGKDGLGGDKEKIRRMVLRERSSTDMVYYAYGNM